MNKRKIGEDREDAVCRCLESHGWTILERNFRARSGEIDIIAREGPVLVFVEVKYRRSLCAGYGSEAVGKRKQKTMEHTALLYMMRHQIDETTPCRFDVAELTGNHLHLYRDAFRMEGGY